jgi:ABC-type dipeptide/oligopeptide/nickel transport system permease component
MLGYTLRRLGQFVPVLLAVTFLIYLAVFQLPGDPIRALFGLRRPDPGIVEEIRAIYGLDEPLLQQYVRFLSNLVTGQLGLTYTGRPINGIVQRAIPSTVVLVGLALIVQVVLGGFVGMYTAIRRQSLLDHLLSGATLAVASIPIFVTATVLQRVFAVDLQLLPFSGARDGLLSYVLPATVLGTASAVTLARLVRSSVGESLRAPPSRLAVAMGVPLRRLVTTHALRPALVLIVTLIAAELANLLTGSILVELIYGLPGLGGILATGLRTREYPLVVVACTAMVVVVLVANLIADLLAGVIDPRQRVATRGRAESVPAGG